MAQSSEEARDELPKVERVLSSQQLTRPQTLSMLSQFLMEEQERRSKLRDECGLSNTWKDLQNAYETVPMFEDPGLAAGGYDTFDGGDGTTGGEFALQGAVGELGKALAMAASPFMGSPDQAALLKEQKLRKARKKKRKNAKKEAKKQAQLYLKSKA